jgi:protein ImuA
MSLDTLLQRADIWRGGENSRRNTQQSISTGDHPLDAQLPGGGWPLGALTELLFEHQGIGEFQLLIPAMAHLSREGRWLVWVAPPHLPYAPALAGAGMDLSRLLLVRPRLSKEALWAMEQALRSGVCGAVLGWPEEADTRTLRRLQLAAEAGGTMGVLFRPLREKKQPSPAALRLQLTPSATGLRIQILKRRGGWTTQPVFLQRSHAVA